MNNLEILSEQEMKSINGGGLFSSISAIINSAVNKDWGGLATAIVETVRDGIKLIGSHFTDGW
jgi:bacteriocin-like protein